MKNNTLSITEQIINPMRGMMNRNLLTLCVAFCILLFILFAAFGINQVNTIFQGQITQTPPLVDCPFTDARDFSVEEEYQFILGFTPSNAEIFPEIQHLPCGEIRKYVYPGAKDALASFEEYKQHALDIMPNNVELLDTDLFLGGIKISIPHSVK